MLVWVRKNAAVYQHAHVGIFVDSAQAGDMAGSYCSPMTLLATTCKDMPTMIACRTYNTLCATGSKVQQCSSNPPIPR